MAPALLSTRLVHGHRGSRVIKLWCPVRSLHVLLGLLFTVGMCDAAGPNPFLFVTQVPVPTEVNDNIITNVFLGIGAGFGNHLGGTEYAPRGGDLWLAKPSGSFSSVTLTNLTRGAGFG